MRSPLRSRVHPCRWIVPLLIAASCGHSGPRPDSVPGASSPAPTPAPTPPSALRTTVRCTTAQGGLVALPGRFAAWIPPGALRVDTDLTADADSNAPGRAFSSIPLLGPAIELRPAGTRFAKPVGLTFKIPAGTMAPSRLVVWAHGKSGGWEALPSVADESAGTVTALTTHFSAFGVGGPAGSAPKINPANLANATDGTNVSQVPWKVTAKITDSTPGGIQAASLYYRHTGDPTFQSMPLTNIGGNNFEAVIPIAFVRNDLIPGSFEVYVQATDNAVPAETSFAPAGAPGTPHVQAGNPDLDGDGMNDRWEIDNALNITLNDAAADPDGDGQTNLQEYQSGSDPHVAGSTTSINSFTVQSLEPEADPAGPAYRSVVTVRPGTGIRLAWATTSCTMCLLTQVSGTLATTGEQYLTLPGATASAARTEMTFSLTCSGAGGSVSRTCRVIVSPYVGRWIESWEIPTPQQGAAPAPHDMALAPGGNLLILDSNLSTVYVCSTAGDLLGTWSGKAGPAKYVGGGSQTGIAVNSTGEAVISAPPADMEHGSNEPYNASIIGLDGIFRRGTKLCSGENFFLTPDGHSWSAGSGLPYLTECAADGSVFREYKAAGTSGYIAAAGVDGFGNVYAADQELHRLVKFKPDGSVAWITGAWQVPLEVHLATPVAVQCTKGGLAYVLNYSGSPQIAVYDAAGRPIVSWGEIGRTPGQFWGAREMIITPAGDMFLMDNRPDLLAGYMQTPRVHHYRLSAEAQSRFVPVSAGVVQDALTGKMWTRCELGNPDAVACSGTPLSYTFTAAGAAAGALVLGGYSDWRLPTPAELRVLTGTGPGSPAVDPAGFPMLTAGWHWTSEYYGIIRIALPWILIPSEWDAAIAVSLDSGQSGYPSVAERYPVLAVRP